MAIVQIVGVRVFRSAQQLPYQRVYLFVVWRNRALLPDLFTGAIEGDQTVYSRVQGVQQGQVLAEMNTGVALDHPSAFSCLPALTGFRQPSSNLLPGPVRPQL